MPEFIKPYALQKGMHIALTAPSGAVRDKDSAERHRTYFENLGYRVDIRKSCFTKYGYLSGEDRERAEEFNACFADDSVDAVFCLRGGYGAARILGQLDYGLIRSHPKIFAGFSDITGFHSAINRYSALVTFHAPNGDLSAGKDGSDFSLDSMLQAMTCTREREIVQPEGFLMRAMQAGCAEGITCGGNLSLLAGSIGTPWAPDFRNKILFIEDIGESVYRLDGMLTHMREAGVFKHCAGIVFGQFINCSNAYPEYALSIEQVIEDVVLPCGKPVIINGCFGHLQPTVTLPLGVHARMETAPCRLILMEGSVR